jgi:hypothetical protein
MLIGRVSVLFSKEIKVMKMVKSKIYKHIYGSSLSFYFIFSCFSLFFKKNKVNTFPGISTKIIVFILFI